MAGDGPMVGAVAEAPASPSIVVVGDGAARKASESFETAADREARRQAVESRESGWQRATPRRAMRAKADAVVSHADGGLGLCRAQPAWLKWWNTVR